MNDEIRVSIITVCKNSKSTISRTIDSVLRQTYKNIEYIIVDGMSDDGTVNIIEDYEKKFDSRLRWISEADDGIFYAMNKGISLASGELIGIINSDDWYERDTVETIVRQYEDIKDEEYIIMYGLLKMWDKKGRELYILRREHERYRITMIPHPTCFVTKRTYDKFGAFNTKYNYVADYDFVINMNENSQVNFRFIDKVLANFTIGGASSGMKWRKELHMLRKEHGINILCEYGKEFINKIIRG